MLSVDHVLLGGLEHFVDVRRGASGWTVNMNVLEVLDGQPRCVCCGRTAVVSHVARQLAV